MSLFSLLILWIFDLIYQEISIPGWFYVGMLIGHLISEWLLSRVGK